MCKGQLQFTLNQALLIYNNLQKSNKYMQIKYVKSRYVSAYCFQNLTDDKTNPRDASREAFSHFAVERPINKTNFEIYEN